MSRDWRLYLDDILESCRRIRSYTTGLDQAGFVGNQLVYDAVLRNLEIIGEAATRIPPDARQKMPQTEWPKIAGMRDWNARLVGARLFPSECRHRLGRDRKQTARTGTNSSSLSIRG